jgi:hypothetical protein
VASPLPAAGQPDFLTCQTPDCNRPIEVVITRIVDSEADMLCQPCCMAFWAAVLKQAIDSGAIDLAEPATLP